MRNLQEVHFVGPKKWTPKKEDGTFSNSVDWAIASLQEIVQRKVTFLDGRIVYEAPDWKRVRVHDANVKIPFE